MAPGKAVSRLEVIDKKRVLGRGFGVPAKLARIAIPLAPFGHRLFIIV